MPSDKLKPTVIKQGDVVLDLKKAPAHTISALDFCINVRNLLPNVGRKGDEVHIESEAAEKRGDEDTALEIPVSKKT